MLDVRRPHLKTNPHITYKTVHILDINMLFRNCFHTLDDNVGYRNVSTYWMSNLFVGTCFRYCMKMSGKQEKEYVHILNDKLNC